MKDFLGDDFFLDNEIAKELYHDYAKDMPIFDYHCHLPPRQIAENTKFENMTQIWLYGDHYKWRAMRSNGVDERFCTGDASDYEKFMKWAETVPCVIGNPLFHWSHMELKSPFGIFGKMLSPATAPEIWAECNTKLSRDEFRVRGIMEQMNVKVVCTTDGPEDTLEYHKAIAADSSFNIKIVPALRPDKAMAVDNPAAFKEYLQALGQTADREITSYRDLVEVLTARHAFFHEVGCRLTDHGIELPVYEEASERELAGIFRKVLSGHPADKMEVRKFKTAIMFLFGRLNAEKGWTMQIHMGAVRNNNTRLYKQLGSDTGFDAIADGPVARPLAAFLDALDQNGQLPKTILYVLNPRDNELIASMIGCFQDGSVPGKMQFGSGWWFNDNKDGMLRQMSALANVGVLSRFVGMLTDSRSFLSYPRHEYFRRLLCNILGAWVEDGEVPKDMDLLGKMVQDISFNNAKDYFGIEL